MNEMDDVEHSYKRLSFFKEMVDELISLSFFLEGEGSSEENQRTIILGSVMEKEYLTKHGITTWYKNTFPDIWKAFETDDNNLINQLKDNQAFIYNHIVWVYRIMQWWVSDEDEPSDELLNWYTSCWEKIEAEYGTYIYKKNRTV